MTSLPSSLTYTLPNSLRDKFSQNLSKTVDYAKIKGVVSVEDRALMSLTLLRMCCNCEQCTSNRSSRSQQEQSTIFGLPVVDKRMDANIEDSIVFGDYSSYVFCSNCGQSLEKHCKLHTIPCCPGKCPLAHGI